MAKTRVARDTRKRFEVYITDLDDNPQDPDTCFVIFLKAGEYGYDSPRGPFLCVSTGGKGYWGYDYYLEKNMTLGDWIARFEWYISNIKDAEDFPFIVEDKDRPWIDKKAAEVR